MKQEPNHIDDRFHQRLHGAEVPPPAFVWVNIESELRKRRRRILFFWLFAAGIGVAGLWAGLSWHNNSRQHETGNHTAATAQPFENTTRLSEQTIASAGESLPENQPNSAASSVNASRGILSIPVSVQKPGDASFVNPPSAEAASGEASGALTIIDNKTGGIEQSGAGTIPEMAAFALLDKMPLQPLAFARKNEWPKGRPFVRKKKDPHFCYDFSEHPTVWMADVYAGPSFAARKLESNGSAFDAYRKQRQDTEQKDFSFNAGLRGSLLFGRHFLLRSGLHYEQMTEVFEYADPDYVKYLVEITNTTIDGKPVTIIDTIGVDYGENYTRTFNRYGMLDIPVEAGLELRSGRFGLSLNGGFSLNILFWKRGAILSAGGKPQTFTPGEKGAVDVFRTRTGLSVEGSAQIFFHLQPRLRIFAEPYFRQILKPVTLENQAVDQRYRISGIKLGLTRILD